MTLLCLAVITYSQRVENWFITCSLVDFLLFGFIFYWEESRKEIFCNKIFRTACDLKKVFIANICPKGVKCAGTLHVSCLVPERQQEAYLYIVANARLSGRVKFEGSSGFAYLRTILLVHLIPKELTHFLS